VLHWDEWRATLQNVQERSKTTMTSIIEEEGGPSTSSSKNKATTRKTQGVLTQKAVRRRTILSKQANKYAATCPVVVLFDWRRMLFLDYRPGRPTPLSDKQSETSGTKAHFAEMELPHQADEGIGNNHPRMMFCDPKDTDEGVLWPFTHRKLLFAALLWGIYKQGGLEVE
jgi:hypothetical protein